MTQQQAAPRVHTRDGEEGLKGTETKAAFKTTEYDLALVPGGAAAVPQGWQALARAAGGS